MHRTMYGLATALTLLVAGCKPEPVAPVQPVGSATSGPTPSQPAATPHPCALLSDVTVAEFLPGSKKGERDPGDEQFGIGTCRWAAGEDHVVLQAFQAGPGALPQELRASSLEIVDVRRPDASTLVRLERFADIEELAGGYVERADPSRGIRRSAAVLMVQRNGHLAVLRIPQLAVGDRAKSLEALRTMAAEISKRL